MLTEIHPKLPMRDKAATWDYYVNRLGFKAVGSTDYPGYLMIRRDHVEIHFFEFRELDPKENYGQVYIRTHEIDELYHWVVDQNLTNPIHAPLEDKPWGVREFSLHDPDNNVLTFGQTLR